MSENEGKILSLFKAVQQGDKAAFDELFLLYHQKLISLARHYVTSQEDAEEITSEMFVKLWLKRGNLSKVSNPEVYLFILIKNASLNVVRSEKRRKLIFSSSTAEEIALYQAVSNPSDRELFLLLNNAVAALPQQRKIIFKLIKEEGLKSKVVAEIMDISVRTVENQLYKAVKSLADTLSGYLGYHPQAKKNGTKVILYSCLYFFYSMSK
ncbi:MULTISPECIES: RNA polymerase sigma-70 factor [unclassified Pedobacter]|uniref:RNA polymerase sigma-70 factor n=1 Tax=unclassified Pedobacter TaxID=2628915 RepID=UPI001E40479D|nr:MULTISPECIES: RNA polymerase sigma-70 factor [unclassified Pedobacter]